MVAYYNEIDPFAASWLRELIKQGLIAEGEVDERSIEDITPKDIKSFTQYHFFAGIGTWSYALKQAGWPDDEPVWTGSCPCQPFSNAHKGDGFNDARHLWPAFHRLINQFRPAIVFGEQVASKAVEPWIDLVQTDMETMGYAFGCTAFPAASIGAPQLRDRAFWLAHTNGEGSQGRVHRGTNMQRQIQNQLPGRDSATGRFWKDADWLYCKDGKYRPVEPGTSPLAARSATHVGRLRGYGNTINAQQATLFIEEAMNAIGDAALRTELLR